MRLSLKWLSKYVDLSGLEVEDIINKTIKAGLEVESVDYLAKATGLVVGKVIECVDHPDSDHLHITKVDIGSEILDIVCGAPNCREGIKVIVATIGAKLPELTIKKGKIRGVESNGMLCSLLELGVNKEMLEENSPSLTGIEELDDRFSIGDTDILEKLGLDDQILDLSVYANRPDLLSMEGMAKEMAAILDRPCHIDEYDGIANGGEKTNFKLHSNTENCSHFLVKVINEITIKPSPQWIKDCLLSSGIKSINNVIDISNLVMLEVGQPMHFYDIETNPNQNITVVDDYQGEYTALDGITYDIKPGDLMIASDNKPIGIAGIMGGDNTKILDTTKGIILESALFSGPQVRKTANRLGLQTEAALRFAKGLDPLAQKKAIDRATDLLIKYADAKGIEETIEFGSDNFEQCIVKETVSHLNKVIGMNLDIQTIEDVLRRLDFNPSIEGEEITVTIPSYRTDIKIAEDLDEEVIRLVGYDNLVSTLPLMPMTIGKLSPRQSMRREIQDILAHNGLNEVISYTLGDKNSNDDSLMPVGDTICLMSPLNDARKYLRTSLINSMCDTLAYNLSRSNTNLNLFEISALYGQNDKVEERLGIILNGNLSESKVLHNKVTNSFYTIKGLVLELLSHLGYDIGRLKVVTNDLYLEQFHPYQSCLIKMNNEVLAVLGKIHPEYAKKKKIDDAYYAEVRLDLLVNNKASKIVANKVSRYPEISRDLSFVVSEDIMVYDILRHIKKAGGELVKHVEVFDVYQGEPVPSGYKSVSFSIVYGADRTLKLEDINPVHEKIMQSVNANYNANIRS